jgi:PAS domain S-box-containing protein
MSWAVIEWDGNGRVVGWSKAAEQLFGRTPQQAIGCDWRQLSLIHSDDADQFETMIIGRSQPGSCCATFRYAANGADRIYEWNHSVSVEADGVIAAVSVVRDVSQVVSKSVARDGQSADESDLPGIELAVRGAQIGIWDWDVKTGRLEWSNRLCQLLKMEVGQVEPTMRAFARLVHRQDLAATRDAVQRSLNPGGQLDVEVRLECGDGIYRWFRIKGAAQGPSVEHDSSGKAIRMAGSLEDIEAQIRTRNALSENEERLRLVFNQQFQFIAVLSAEGWVLDINELPLKVQGVSRQDYLGRLFWECPAWEGLPDWQQTIRSRVTAALESFEPVHAEDEFLDADGRRHYATATYTAIRDDDGTARYVVVQASDVTERRKVEESLRRSEQRFRKLLQHAPEAVVLLDVEQGRFFMLNVAAERMFRMSAEELIGKTPIDVSPELQPDGRTSQEACQHYVELACSGETPCFEWVHCDVDGQPILCEVRLLALEVDDRMVVRGSMMDISERKRAERALHESENLFRGAFEDAVTPCALLESNGRYIRVNDAFCRMVGRSRSELMGVHYYQITHPDDMEQDADENQQLMTGQADSFSGREKRYLHRDGHYVWAMISISIVRDNQGDPLYRILQAQEITERKRIEAELEETRAILLAAIEASPAGIIIADAPDAKIRSVNAAALDICDAKPSDVDELPFPYYPDRWKCRHPDGSPFLAEEMPLTRAIRDGVVSRNVDVLIERPDGSEHWVLGNAAPVRNAEGQIVAGVVVFPDVTEQKRAAAALRRSEAELAHVMRLSSMGEMVGGIAHELNQPLYAVQNYSKACANLLSSDEVVDHDRLVGWLNRISDAAVHGGAVLQRLRDFVKQKPANKSRIDLNEVVEMAVSFVRYEAEQRNVTLTSKTADGSVPISGDSVQIQQVVMNLILNAFDAVQISEHPPAIEIDVRKLEDTVEVVVADNGVGLPHDVEVQIFKAFHSTKPNGMGLGLAIATTIVESHGGALIANNNAGGGASFSFTLPLASE